MIPEPVFVVTHEQGGRLEHLMVFEEESSALDRYELFIDQSDLVPGAAHKARCEVEHFGLRTLRQHQCRDDGNTVVTIYREEVRA